ncbi:dipeptidase [Ammoniphilus resinae]|uniref:Membrane dipeptidase n=1 Tax=Ammoniphilus resinae TaxID=861532 RepID=A0ABS4GNY6_9BACL|nr:dipeptidase [Ammoniphilus resinae]MBP1931570.1 membrane dipeptidase [Ammoniphilus resinae]
MKIFDAHCDVLWKMAENQQLSFYDSNDLLQLNYEAMKESNIGVQAFALFVPPTIPSQLKFDYVLKMIDIYHEQILNKKHISPILTSNDLRKILHNETNLRGGILTLEGVDALQGKMIYLRTLYQLGVRGLGFTWNYRNEAADGVEEPKPGGLSKFGRELLKEANRLGMVLDVSHLSEPGFWDVIELTASPIIASHSNCQVVHLHRRNLSDDQLHAIFKLNGVIGLTFVPSFISGNENVFIPDLLMHLEHILVLGGEDHVAFGSDFDGITRTMSDLSNAKQYHRLVNTLLQTYKEAQVEKWLHGNWQRVFQKILG